MNSSSTAHIIRIHWGSLHQTRKDPKEIKMKGNRYTSEKVGPSKRGAKYDCMIKVEHREEGGKEREEGDG